MSIAGSIFDTLFGWAGRGGRQTYQNVVNPKPTQASGGGSRTQPAPVLQYSGISNRNISHKYIFLNKILLKVMFICTESV